MQSSVDFTMYLDIPKRLIIWSGDSICNRCFTDLSLLIAKC